MAIIEGQSTLSCKRNNTLSYTSEISVHDIAVRGIDHIHEMPGHMHAQGYRSVLYSVPEGKLHLIAIPFSHRRACDTLIYTVQKIVITMLFQGAA